MEELEAFAGFFFLLGSSCGPTAYDHWTHPVLVKRLRVLKLLQLWQSSVRLEFFLLEGFVLLFELGNLVNHSLFINIIVICLYLRGWASGLVYRLLLSGTLGGAWCLWLWRGHCRGRARWRSSRCSFSALGHTQLELILVSAGYICPRLD